MPRFVIIGAGPCGLGAAFRLNELQAKDWTILESLPHPGGLATSFLDAEGFTWDVGGHVQFSHYEDFDRAMHLALPKGWLDHQRESWVWMEGRFVPYPFQNNIHRLSEEKRDLCLQGLMELQKKQKTQLQNFGDWIDQQFGSGIASIFMRPYNFKVWAYPPEQMNFTWIGERVATIDLERIRENIRLHRDDLSWGPNNTFQFPKKGGTGAIWNSLAKQVGEGRIRYNQKILQIDRTKKEIHLETGEIIKFDYLLSTMPLNKLCDMTKVQMKGQLLASNSHIVGVGLRGSVPDMLKTKCWMYFPEHETPFYRVTVFSNYSPANTPDPATYWSLMCETSSSPSKVIDEKNLIHDCVEALIKIGFVKKRSEVVSTWEFTARPGYPTPSLDRDLIVDHALSDLESSCISSRGRFGAWKYEVSNQDHTFMQGFEWADRIIRNIPEDTVFYPDKVNAPGKRPMRRLS